VKASDPAPSAGRMKAVVFDPARGKHEDIAEEAISDALEQGSIVWLDIAGPSPEDLAMLGEEFGLHPLELEVILEEHPRPRCIEMPGHYTLVMYAAGREADGTLSLREVVIFVGKGFLITAHVDPLPEVDECLLRWKRNTLLHRDAVAAPVYSLLDTLVDGYFPVVDELADKVEEIEDAIYVSDGEAFSEDLLEVKKEMLALRRVVAGERDALNVMLRHDVALFSEGSLLFFQSVYDHLVRLTDTIDIHRDLLASVMDLRMSALSNRMNQVMKTLTVDSTILMSATLIAGIYGMNFKHMPELEWKYGYYAALGAMAVIGGLLVWVFRRLKWF
jgi:magnesium transporter